MPYERRSQSRQQLSPQFRGGPSLDHKSSLNDGPSCLHQQFLKDSCGKDPPNGCNTITPRPKMARDRSVETVAAMMPVPTTPPNPSEASELRTRSPAENGS
eukprot:scaffold127488_cov44-Attheya_sp.AAC.6